MVPAMAGGSTRISPTAHFTGYVWYQHGLGDPALRTRTGQLLVAAFAPIDRLARWAGGPNLEDVLLARHRAIDDLLERAIATRGVSQVLEVASGLSPRGLRFTHRFGSRLRYVEADLPGMARRKREALERAAGRRDPEQHRVIQLDALAESGPASLAAVAETHLDPDAGLAIITEGLVNYFDRQTVEAMWSRFAAVLARHPHGLYVSDLHLAEQMEKVRGARSFAVLVSLLARGRVHIHYRDEGSAGVALLAAGFAEARLHPAGRAPVCIVEARMAARAEPPG